MFRVILQNYREANVSMAAFDICAEQYEICFENERIFFPSIMIDSTNHIQLLSEQVSNFVHLERADFLSACFLSSILRCKCFEALFDWLIHKTLSSHWSTKRLQY